MTWLWQKKSKIPIQKDLQDFCVGEDFLYDQKLVEYDVYASIAHAQMLEQIGILNPNERKQIQKELKNIQSEYQKGNFVVQKEDEDLHSKIENRLTEKLGSLGEKIHTARSRNDQILVVLRLYTKDSLLKLKESLIHLLEDLLEWCRLHEWIPMPGYTHLQRAMPSSVGLWSASFIENLLDDISFLDFVYDLNDQCPLGSGAGYGVSLHLDREFTQKALGFRRLQKNVLYCANSRGKIESNVLSALSSISATLGKISHDLITFTTKEFGFFVLGEEVTTGSSIMPQKQNADPLELIRARCATVLGLEFSAKTLIHNLPSGYNRDLQESKGFFVRAFETLVDIPETLRKVLAHLTPNEKRLLESHDPELYATDWAYQKVQDGMPFRSAYRFVAENLNQIPNFDPKSVLKNRKTLGSTGNLQLEAYETSIKNQKKELQNEKETFFSSLQKLVDVPKKL